MPRIAADSVAEHRALMMGKLLYAFGDLVHEEGYAVVTLAQVAARAGMARNTVYNYVGDKQALLMAFIDRSVEQFVDRVRSELAALPWVGHRSPRWEPEPLRFAGANAGLVAMESADLEEQVTRRPSLISRALGPLLGH